jgi:hypothetical protein
VAVARCYHRRDVPDADQPRRKPGRPRGVPHCSLTVWVPTDTYDALARTARQLAESVSALARRVLTKTVASSWNEGA